MTTARLASGSATAEPMANPSQAFSVFDVLDLPPFEREVFLHIARDGPADAEALAEACDQPRAAVREALAAPAKRGRLPQARR